MLCYQEYIKRRTKNINNESLIITLLTYTTVFYVYEQMVSAGIAQKLKKQKLHSMDKNKHTESSKKSIFLTFQPNMS